MRITDIMIWRDGGTITFTVDDSGMVGRYRLDTPFHGEIRALFRDDQELPRGGSVESALLVQLRAWLGASLTNDTVRTLIRTVITCLEARCPG